ncbi:MAG: heme-copper oxidase subunit III [Brevinematia bacterium]
MESKSQNINVHSSEISVWPFILGISLFLLFFGFIIYFVFEQQVIGFVFIVFFLTLLIFSSTGWANEIFYFSNKENLGVRATIWFICAESIIFGVLIVSFISSRVQFFDKWIEFMPERGFNYALLLLLTFILWLSSFTIWKSENSLEHKDLYGYRFWLILTMVLGVLFLVLHFIEWRVLWEEGFTISSNVFGTGFYSLTGVHASHVLVGILIQFVLLLNSGKSLDYLTPIRVGSFYWHFVDIAWLFVASTAYIVGGYSFVK